jgi:hypothetical protein
LLSAGFLLAVWGCHWPCAHLELNREPLVWALQGGGRGAGTGNLLAPITALLPEASFSVVVVHPLGSASKCCCYDLQLRWWLPRQLHWLPWLGRNGLHVLLAVKTMSCDSYRHNAVPIIMLHVVYAGQLSTQVSQALHALLHTLPKPPRQPQEGEGATVSSSIRHLWLFVVGFCLFGLHASLVGRTVC